MEFLSQDRKMNECFSSLSLWWGITPRCRHSEGLPASCPRLRIIAQQNTMKSVNLLLHLLYHQHLSGIETVPDFRERGRKDGPHKNMCRTRVPVMLQLYTQHESDVLIYKNDIRSEPVIAGRVKQGEVGER